VKTYSELMELERCLDEGRSPSAQLLRRLDADPRLRRRARALRRVDARLREELRERASERPNAARLLPALGPRPTRREATVSRWVVLAAAAALVAWLVPQRPWGPGPSPSEGDGEPALFTQLLRWRGPLEREQIPPQVSRVEGALVEEGRKLVADTRHVARSLSDRLPLMAWLTRGEPDGR